MRKGFTLIELLAVIVIIGLISVLIIPKVQNTLKESKQKTYEASTHALQREADNFYIMKASKRTSFEGCTYDFTNNANTCNGFEFTGEKPESGLLSINSEGEVSFALKFDEYCYSKSFNNDSIDITKTNDCVIPKTIGEIITINGEKFYVIDSNAEETKLLAMYNINVGDDKDPNLPENKQDESLDGSGEYGDVFIYQTYSTLSITDPCPTDDGSSYLKPKYGTSYPIYYYDEDSDAYEYLEAYKSILTNVKEIKLPSYEDIVNLGCNEQNCDNAYPWVYGTSYWLGTAKNYEAMYMVNRNRKRIDQSFSRSASCGGELGGFALDNPGLRPVIIVNTKDI